MKIVSVRYGLFCLKNLFNRAQNINLIQSQEKSMNSSKKYAYVTTQL